MTSSCEDKIVFLLLLLLFFGGPAPLQAGAVPHQHMWCDGKAQTSFDLHLLPRVSLCNKQNVPLCVVVPGSANLGPHFFNILGQFQEALMVALD